MNKILVIGSMNMDYTIYCENFPKDGETIYGINRIVQPGGKGANQACAAGKANFVPVSFISSCGKDADGENIENLIKSLGITAFFKKNDNVPTGNATIFVNGNSENQIIIIAGANALLTKEDIPLNLLEEYEYIILQNEIPNETNEYIIKEAHKLGKKVIYNPAPYRPFDDSIYPCIEYFVVNEVELACSSNTDSIEEGIKVMIEKGVKNLIVTLGAKGSLLANKDGVISVPANKVKAIDTVAAGDTYVGYFVASIASGHEPKKAMEIASIASSITVTRKGSIISIPFGEEVI